MSSLYLRMRSSIRAVGASADCLAAGLLLAGDGALGALAGAGVGLGALAVHRQVAAVTQTLVAADLDLAADVGGDLAAQVTLELVGEIRRAHVCTQVTWPVRLLTSARTHKNSHLES